MNFPKNASKQHKRRVKLYVTFEKEKNMLIFVFFSRFEYKGLFTTNPNFLLDLPLFKLVGKNKLS